MIYFLLIFSILIWPFGQLLNLNFSGFTVYPLDIATTLVFLSLIISKKDHKKIFADPLFKPLLFFLGAAAISLMVNYRQVQLAGITSLLYLVRLVVYPSVYFAVKLIQGKRVLSYLILSFATLLTLSILQYLFLPDMRFLKYLGFDDHYFRLIGPFFDPNFLGLIFASSALVVLAINRNMFSWPLILLLGLTFSRASYLSFTLGFIYLIMSKKNWKLLFSLLVLAVIIVLIPKPFGEGVNLYRTFSIFSRIESSQSGMALFMEKPLLGWGYNTLGSITGERYQIDNSFIFVLATTGLLGLIALFNLLKSTFNQVSLYQRVFLITIITHSLFNNSLFYIWIYYYFWIILATNFKEYKRS